MAQTSSSPFAVRIQPRPALSTSFKLTSAVGGASLPFTLGHAFKKGEVAAGANVVGSIPDLQVVGKNWWPDGSLKFAIISGRATLPAGVAQSITLTTGTPSGGATLTMAHLKATGITAAVNASAFGSASWSGTDWDAPYKVWISGPMMSSWLYRKQIGSDAHLVAWLEVRLYVGGAVEVLPWIENGYLKVAGPTNKNATYTFSLGGTQRFSTTIDLPNHCRTVLISGSAMSYWLGADPAVTPKHDTAYLGSTKLVPNYSVTPSAALLDGLTQTYSPLQLSDFYPSMGNTGYQWAIGILPEWDVLYLTSEDPRAYAAVIINGFSAGRYGIHFRDEITNRPIKFSDHPHLVLDGSSGVSGTSGSATGQYTPSATGTVPPNWDSAHHPSVGYFAYLTTGRFYFMEEVQFSATIHYLKSGSGTDERSGSNGVYRTNVGSHTLRGAAWAMRTLAQACCATPDGDSLRSDLIASFEANITHYHTNVMPSNNFGIVPPYTNYTSGYFSTASWQEDFYTAAIGYAKSMELGLSATGNTKLDEFFTWKSKYIIGRLGRAGIATEWNYRDAAAYYYPISPLSGVPNWSNQASYYPSWQAMYEKAFGHPNNEPDGPLRGGNYPGASSYWGNLMPALAYAVEHNVPGALDAYKRMTSASNWSEFSADLKSSPVWGVRPRNV